MEYAKIENGRVARIAQRHIAAREGWLDDAALVGDGCQIGSLFDGETFSKPPAPPATLSDVQAEASRRMLVLTAGYTPEERETWPIQAKEAAAYIEGENMAPVMLTALSTARGAPLSGLVQRVDEKARAYAAATGQIIGAQAKLASMSPIPQDYAEDKWWA